MAEARRHTRGGVLLLTLAILAGCAGSPPASPGASAASAGGSPASSGAVAGATSSPPALPGGVKVGPIDPATAAALLGTPTTDQDKLNAAAADLGTALRARVNAAAVYGQTATDLQALMDKADADALQKLQQKVNAALGAADASPIRLAAYHQAPAGVAAPSNLVVLSLGYLFVILVGAGAIQEYDPRRGDVAPASVSTSTTTTSGGKTVDVNVTATFSSTGGVVTATVNLDATGSGTDANGKAISMKGSSTISFTINPCPDPAGHVAGTVAIADDETFASSGGPTIGYKVSGDTDYQNQVDDQAQVASTTFTSHVEVASTTVTNPASGSPDTSTVDVAVTGSDTATGSGAFAPGGGSMSVDKADGPAQQADVLTAAGVLGTYGYGIPILITDFARKVWQGGRCFEIRVTPDGGSVTTGSKTPVKVTVYHWVDKADINVPVKATLAGSKAVDPNGTPVTSPATFTFTAGAPNSTGDVTYKVTSKRGISEKTSTFKVDGNLYVDINGTLKETASVVTYNLKITARGINIFVHNDGSIDVNGSVAVTGTANAYVCTGKINERIDVIGRVTLAGTPDAPVYHVLLGPGSVHNLGGTFSCPGITTSSNQGDFFGQWSTAIGPVDLPAAGGTITRSGSNSVGGLLNRSATGTFIATLPK